MKKSTLFNVFIIAIGIAAFGLSVAPASAQKLTGGLPAGDEDETSDTAKSGENFRVLIFSKTAGYRHVSIEDGVRAIKKLGEENSFAVDHTENAGLFTDDYLKKYQVVIFLSTTGDVLNDTQQEIFRRFIQSGGGYVGVHAAADTEYDWPWYGELVGAYFIGHPHIQEADIVVVDQSHPATHHLAQKWTRTDEWYNYKEQLNDDVTLLMTLDEATYEGGSMGETHPIAWCHKFDGGRAFYTGGGHTKESYREESFLNHLLGGIRWAAKVKESAS